MGYAPRCFLQAMLCIFVFCGFGASALADKTFNVPKGKKIDVKYQRHRDEVSHIKVEYRKSGAADWQTIANVFVEPKDVLHTAPVNAQEWDASCARAGCEVRVSGFMKIGNATQPFGFENIDNQGNVHSVTLWGSQGDGSQNTTVTITEN